MKRQKKLLLLLGLLVIVSAVTLGVMKQEEHKEKIKNTPATVLEMKDIDSVSWDYNDVSYTFRKEDGTWVYDADAAFPVDPEKMDDLLSQFASLGAAFTIEEPEDLGQYGLEKPQCTIRLTAGEQTAELTLGDFSQMDSQRYAALGDGNVYLLSHDPMEEFDTDLSGLILQDEIPTFGTVENIALSGGDSFTRNEEGTGFDDDDLYFRDSDGGALDTDRVNAFVKNLQNTSLTDYVTYNATEQDLADCYLAEPEKTVTLTYIPEEAESETQTFTLHLGKEPDPSDDETGQAYARVGDSKILYRISDTTYEALMACDYNDLRHKDVFCADFDQADSMTVTMEGTTWEFTKEIPEDTDEAVWMLNGEAVDMTDVETTLKCLTAEEFTANAPADRQELSVTVHLDREGPDEMTVTLYRQDGKQSLAQLNGKSLCYLRRSDAVSLTEALNAILLG